MEINYKNFFISAICVSAVAGLGYAFYFDHKRRNDRKFRKDLKKHRDAQKNQAKEEESKSKEDLVNESAKRLAVIYKSVKDSPAPNPAEFEQFFFNQLNMGEMLLKEGPAQYEAAAAELFRAIVHCPNPVEVVMMLENIIPKEVNQIVLALFSIELQSKREEYMEFYKKYPSSDKNVLLKEDASQPESAATDGIKKFHATATKAFNAGEVIYTEKPIVSALVPSLEGRGFCSVCFKKTESPIKHSFLNRDYCSEVCHEAAVNELPLEAPSKGSMELLTRFNDDGKMLASMLARCLSKAFYQHESGNTAIPEPENYTPMLHTERYHAVDFSSEGGFETEVELIQDFLRFRTEDADQVITPEYYTATIGKFARACFAVANAPSDPEVVACPQTNEPLRYVVPAPFTGCGFYPLSAYLESGLAQANCQIEFRSTDNVLTLVSTKPIKEGETLIVATFEASSAKPEVATSTEIPTEADFPPLGEEASSESLKPAPVEQRAASPSYAEVVVDAPSSDEKPVESTDAAPSHVAPEAVQEAVQEVVQEAVQEAVQEVVQEAVQEAVQEIVPEPTQEKEDSQLSSYAEVAAEEPSSDADVVANDDITSSQEFEKVEEAPEVL